MSSTTWRTEEVPHVATEEELAAVKAVAVPAYAISHDMWLNDAAKPRVGLAEFISTMSGVGEYQTVSALVTLMNEGDFPAQAMTASGVSRQDSGELLVSNPDEEVIVAGGRSITQADFAKSLGSYLTLKSAQRQYEQSLAAAQPPVGTDLTNQASATPWIG